MPIPTFKRCASAKALQQPAASRRRLDLREAMKLAASAFRVGPILKNYAAPEQLLAQGATLVNDLPFLAASRVDALIQHYPEIGKLLPALADALSRNSGYAPEDVFDLSTFSADDRRLLLQLLGEGEVTGTVALPDGIVAEIQATALAGLWHIRFMTPAGQTLVDYLEAGPIPAVVEQAAAATPAEIQSCETSSCASGLAPVLAEIRYHVAIHVRGALPFRMEVGPMAPQDRTLLRDILGTGTVELRVQLFSDGLEACRIASTGVSDVWSVQFFDAMNQLARDTLEIGDVPDLARADPADFKASAARLHVMGAV